MKQAHNSSSMPKVCSDTSPSSMFSILFSIPLLSILATNFAVCVMRLIVWWLLHFVASGFFFKAVIVTSLQQIITKSSLILHNR